jgi:hypothetical protein
MCIYRYQRTPLCCCTHPGPHGTTCVLLSSRLCSLFMRIHAYTHMPTTWTRDSVRRPTCAHPHVFHHIHIFATLNTYIHMSLNSTECLCTPDALACIFAYSDLLMCLHHKRVACEVGDVHVSPCTCVPMHVCPHARVSPCTCVPMHRTRFLWAIGFYTENGLLYEKGCTD